MFVSGLSVDTKKSFRARCEEAKQRFLSFIHAKMSSSNIAPTLPNSDPPNSASSAGETWVIAEPEDVEVTQLLQNEKFVPEETNPNDEASRLRLQADIQIQARGPCSAAPEGSILLGCQTFDLRTSDLRHLISDN